jgi:hypothetical protein
MRPLLSMDTIQIEITNGCVHQCGNCTRFVGHHKKPFLMDFETFKKAVDSMVGYPKMTGIMGGEPLIHPDFERMCWYLHSKIPAKQCGLWTTFPKGYEEYREVIVKTFGNIFLNDHTREDIMHKPILVSAAELPLEEWQKWILTDSCYGQMSWSASINPYGAYFCEIAASLAILLEKKYGKNGNEIAWEVKPGWWTRSPMHFTSQIKEFCGLCGLAMPLKARASVDGIDDISPKMFERLKSTSPKIKAGKYQIHDLKLCQDQRPLASYKQVDYRQKIAARYGMFTMPNDICFEQPYLLKNWKKGGGEKNGKINEKDVCTVG